MSPVLRQPRGVIPVTTALIPVQPNAATEMVRWCACGTKLSRYNLEDACAQCLEAARRRELGRVRPPRAYKRPIGDRWARQYDHCIDCGKTTHPHQGRGYCSPCYWWRLRHNQARPDDLGKKWSRAGHTACLRCGKDDQPHRARGYCRRCYTTAMSEQAA